jgi:hypothetical protein
LGILHSELLNIYLKFADTTSILSQIRGKIGDFIIGVFSVFQGEDVLAHSFNVGNYLTCEQDSNHMYLNLFNFHVI